MASKSKQKRLQAMNRKETATLAVSIAIIGAILAIFQNSYGQFSDIRGFYGMHFADGQHQWPFSTHTLLGSTQEMHPVEYPALTGLVMWLFSFFIAPAQSAWVDYFRLTASVHVVLFGYLALYLQKLSSKNLAIVFAISPAVLYSLNRNWDIWAILPMIAAIHLFEKKRIKLSAFWLAVSIATKFFPLVAFLPITVYYYRNKRLRDGIKFVGLTVGFWLSINVPFMVINFRGWSYFYEFSYRRSIGSASVFDIASALGKPLANANLLFYILNVFALVLVVLYLFKSSKVISIAEGTFFTMFAFILFNKQYSMQYVIWLASLATLAISYLNRERQIKMLILYGIWQVSELVFQFSFFQNILTNKFAGTTTPASPQITATEYGVAGLIRYLLAITFTLALAHYLNAQRKQDAPTKKLGGGRLFSR
jgi:uncharacterized membrane protein